jgi:hypothetical protein
VANIFSRSIGGGVRNADDTTPIKAAKRTFELKMLVVGMLVAAFFGFLRFQQTLRYWDLLLRMQAEPGPVYMAVSGLLWGLVGIFTAGVLWLGRPWAARAGRIAAVVIAGSYWGERLLLYRSPASQANALFAALITVVLVAFAFGVLALPRQRRFFARPVARGRFAFWRIKDGKSRN